MEHTILILALPLLSFLLLGLLGNRMPHRLAGALGTLSLAAATALSYWTAAEYFLAGRTADGTFAELMPYNMTWLPLGDTLSIDMEYFSAPYL